MAIELIIFDCDGVLVDSEPIANRMLAKHLSAIGLPTSYEQSLARYRGRSLQSCLELVETQLGKPLTDDFLTDLQLETFAEFRRNLQPVSGVKEVLEQLTLPVCVASSGDHKKIQLTLSITGLLDYFPAAIFSASEVSRGKPAPDLFLYASEKMSVLPQNCLVVEDAPVGVEAAVKAGMQVIGYAGHTDQQLLLERGARTFNCMSEFFKLLYSMQEQ